jgi:uncharacterized protein YceK
MRKTRAVLVAVAITVVISACAAKLYQPPTGPGVPFAEAGAVWLDVTAHCRVANVFVAEVAVSGWLGETRERLPSFTAHSAVTREDDIYLEVPAPGKSVVQMAGRAGEAVLLLPRDERWLRAPSSDIVETLTGLRWGARDLLNVLSGCVTIPSGEFSGMSYGTIASIELGNDSRAWVRQRDGRWQLQAADRDGLRIEYQEYLNAFPSRVRVSSIAANVTPLRLNFVVSQHNVNNPLATTASTFVLDVPQNFVPITLEELRTNRPIKDGKDGKTTVSRKP